MLACTQSCPVRDRDLSGVLEADSELEMCSAYHKAKSAMSAYFHFESFQRGQLAALLPVLHVRDVLAKIATGAGNLCFFLVPLSVSTTAAGVVICPLNA